MSAKNKAYYKTAILISVFFFFLYAAVMNIGNQLIFNLKNSRTNGLLITGSFVLLAYIMAEKKLKHRLTLLEDVTNYEADKLKAYDNFQVKVALLSGIYAIVMFCVIRLMNIYLF